MKTLYLHIGMMKTGTTAIQKFLVSNTELLANNNFIYPMMPYRYEYVPSSRNAHFLYSRIEDSNRASEGKKNTEMVEDCLDVIVKAFKDYDNVIISDEILFWHLGCRRTYRAEMLLKCAEENGFTIKIIAYLRRQDYIVESVWNQNVKHYASQKSFEEYIDWFHVQGRLEYYNRIETIADLFGEDNVIVRRYQKEDLLEGSSVTDFLRIIGINATADISSDIDTTRRNVRLSNNLVFYKQQINRFSTSGRKGGRLSEEALLKSTDRVQEVEYISTMMGSDGAREFMSEFEAANNQLAEKYIKDGKPLFNDKYSQADKWQPNNPAMLEDFIAGSAAMFGAIQDIIEEQNARIKALEEKNKSLMSALKHPVSSQFKKLIKK